MDKIKEKIGKIWNVVKSSKLNMSMFISGVVAFVLCLIIVCVICFRGEGINNKIMTEETTTEQKEEKTTKNENKKDEEKDTDSENAVFSTEIDESQTGNVVETAKVMKAKATIKDSWVDDGEYYIQYNIDMTNISGKDIKGWAALITLESSGEIIDEWNFDFESIKSKKIKICPRGSNVTVEDDNYVSGGFVIKGSQYVYIDYITVYVGDSVETLKNYNKNAWESQTKKEETEEETTTEKKTYVEEETTIENETTTEESSLNEETTTPENKTEEDTTKPEESTTLPEETTTPENNTENNTGDDIPENNG